MCPKVTRSRVHRWERAKRLELQLRFVCVCMCVCVREREREVVKVEFCCAGQVDEEEKTSFLVLERKRVRLGF